MTTEKVLPQLDKEKSYYRKYIMMRWLYTLLFVSNFIIQCFNFNAYVKVYQKEKDTEMFALLIIHWTSTIIIFMLLVSSFLWPKKKWISPLLTIVIIARNFMPLLDLEGRRKRQTPPSNIFFLV